MSRSRIAWNVVGGLAVVAIVTGVIVRGPEFLITPLAIPTKASRYWFTINLVLVITEMILIAMRVYAPEEKGMSWQRRARFRGLFLLLSGSVFGILYRAFGAGAQTTIGTPFVSVACVVLIYGTLGPDDSTPVSITGRRLGHHDEGDDEG